MRHRLTKAVWAVAALLALAAVAVACGKTEDATSGGATPSATPSATPLPAAATPAPTPSFPVTVTDSGGKEVTFQAPPRKVVALAPSFVEVLYAIDAGASIVAVDDNTDFPPEAAAKAKISGFQPSVEGIAGLEPDLVLLVFDPGGLRDALEQLGIAVLLLDSPASVEASFRQIELLGKVAGRSTEAQALITVMLARIEAITGKLSDVQQGPTVFHELDVTLFTAGPGSFIGDLYGILKARNVADATGQPYPQMNAEEVIEADPEVIILADEDAGESPATVAARAGWGQVSAVREGRVYTIDPDIVSRPGPRLVVALETLAKLLYPERFQ